MWRRRRDSNPRRAFDPYTISNRAPSTSSDNSPCSPCYYIRLEQKNQEKNLIKQKQTNELIFLVPNGGILEIS